MCRHYLFWFNEHLLMQLIGVPGEELAAAWYSARIYRLLSGRHDPHVGCDLEIYILCEFLLSLCEFFVGENSEMC